MKQKAIKIISGATAFLLGIAFVAKFGGPAFLRLYVETGVGNCQKIPILCMAPDTKVITPGQIDREYLNNELIPYNFPKISLAVPRGFKVIQEEIKRDYYKRKGRPYSDAAIYVIYEEPGFFIGLYPQLKKRGISDNYQFIKHTMYAGIKGITNFTDLFFIIMKGIFTPDLGDQRNVKMTQFRIGGKRGFINYNLAEIASSFDKSSGRSPERSRRASSAPAELPRNDGHAPVNYFDCNIIDDQDGFFKIYIKDTGARLDLNRVLAIISTADNI